MKTFSGNTQRKLGTVVAAGAAMMLISGFAMAASDIANTKHNLSSTGTSAMNNFTATNGASEICVFCHTPHGGDTAAPVPLWNRVMNASASYSTYASLGTSTLDAQTVATGSVSLACLSCHDGVQAMNNFINAPGSGGYNPAGAVLAGTWSGPAATATPVGSLSYAAASIVNIGTDLQNDHPIGIQFGGGGAPSYAAGTDIVAGTTNDKDFNLAKAVAGKQVWWVDAAGGTAGVKESTDMQLYTRSDTSTYLGAAITGGTQPYVECASCHDPHSSNTTFLRTVNTGSAVCLACHAK